MDRPMWVETLCMKKLSETSKSKRKQTKLWSWTTFKHSLIRRRTKESPASSMWRALLCSNTLRREFLPLVVMWMMRSSRSSINTTTIRLKRLTSTLLLRWTKELKTIAWAWITQWMLWISLSNLHRPKCSMCISNIVVARTLTARTTKKTNNLVSLATVIRKAQVAEVELMWPETITIRRRTRILTTTTRVTTQVKVTSQLQQPQWLPPLMLPKKELRNRWPFPVTSLVSLSVRCLKELPLLKCKSIHTTNDLNHV